MASSSSKTEFPQLPGRIRVGRVTRPHGVRGEVAVEPLSDVAARFAAGSELEAVTEAGLRPLRVARSRAGGRAYVVAFEGVDDRDAAEALRGAALEVARSRVPPAAAGEYYYYELVGCLCVDAREGELGRVVDVEEGAAGIFLVAEHPGGRRVPLPFVAAFVAGVDLDERRIDWQLPEGLIEACASRS